jgi:hypothetical protein
MIGFEGTDTLFNTESVPSNISYKSFKIRIYLMQHNIPTVITETLIV